MNINDNDISPEDAQNISQVFYSNYVPEDKLPNKDRPKPETPHGGYQSPATYTFVGKMGFGKTYNCIKLLKQKMIDKQISRIFLLSPTHKTNYQWKSIPIYKILTDLEQSNNFLKDIKLFGTAEYELWEAIHKEYTQQEFYDAMEHQSAKDVNGKYFRKWTKLHTQVTEAIMNFSEGDPSWYDRVPCSALVIDDCLNSKVFSRSYNLSYFNNLYIRHRHAGLEIYILVQALSNSFAKSLRDNTRVWVIWPYQDDKMLSNMYEEVGTALCTRAQFKEMIKYLRQIQDPNKNFLIFDNITLNSPMRIGFNIICYTPESLIENLQLLSDNTQVNNKLNVSGQTNNEVEETDISERISTPTSPASYFQHYNKRLRR